MDPDPDLGKEIEVDPDLDPERRLKWIRIRNAAVGTINLSSYKNLHMGETKISLSTRNVFLKVQKVGLSERYLHKKKPTNMQGR